ncbi:armadillo/beta-catenin-like repeat protein [Medicago truncatula]|uniref:Armadillo/beta-catenin-like repeat protein n=1 Tax=Medicago truncatula TaxID=3880 RepID=G7J2G6_MEDTR|nr:armadillo/beta-catenin-like repeat protein [Medicago truncatula]
MRAIAAQFSNYLCRRRVTINQQSRNFSSSNSKDEHLLLEHEVERKFGWLLKSIFFGSALYAGYQFFPYMGENLMHQSVSLLRVKDPLFKRMGASRLARFAKDGTWNYLCISSQITWYKYLKKIMTIYRFIEALYVV